MMGVSGASLLAAWPLAFLARYIGNGKITTVACVVQLILLVSFLVISPDEDTISALFIIGSLWGIVDAVLQTQVGGTTTTSI